MNGWFAVNWVSPLALALHERATELVRRFPESDASGRPIRCHEAARVCGALLSAQVAVDFGMDALDALDLKVVDGRLGAIEHSWLTLVDGYRRLVLDVYAPGRVPPVQLLDAERLAGIAAQYEPGEVRTDLRNRALAELMRTATPR